MTRILLASVTYRRAKMAWDEEDDTTTLKIVVNREDQYAIWPAGRNNPSGWQAIGKQGRKRECVKYIDDKWPGMRPLRLLK